MLKTEISELIEFFEERSINYDFIDFVDEEMAPDYSQDVRQGEASFLVRAYNADSDPVFIELNTSMRNAAGVLAGYWDEKELGE